MLQRKSLDSKNSLRDTTLVFGSLDRAMFSLVFDYSNRNIKILLYLAKWLATVGVFCFSAFEIPFFFGLGLFLYGYMSCLVSLFSEAETNDIMKLILSFSSLV